MVTAQVSLEPVADRYAINSVFTTYTRDRQVYCYSAKQLDYQMRRMGVLTFAVRHLELISEFTRECKEFVFAVLHLGSWDFHCCIEPFKDRRFYSDLKEQLFASLERASVASVIMATVQLFGKQSFSLSDLFVESASEL